MNKAIACEYLRLVIRKCVAAEISHAATGFFDYDCACGSVPRVEAQLPETVESPARNIAQVNSCRAVATKRLRVHGEVSPVVEVRPFGRFDIVRETGRKQALSQVTCFRYADGALIQRSAASALCREKLIAHGIVDYAEYYLPFPFKRDGDAKHRIAV